MARSTAEERRQRFHALHEADDIFVMPNPFDAGSARLLESLGFPAVATTSSGFAASLGVHDQATTRDQLIEHVAAITDAIDIPLNVDAERCFADTPEGVADTIHRLAGVGAAGCSIEDYDPVPGALDPLEVAVERVAAAATAAHEHGIVLTARAEAHLYGSADIAATIERLLAFAGAGADVVYAPGLIDLGEIERLVREVGRPVNVLVFAHGPSVPQLAEVGVRRISTGGALAWAAYGAVVRAAEELRTVGTSTYAREGLSREHRRAFDDRN